MLSRLAVRSAVRAPRGTAAPVAVRFYSENAFNKKEKAHEGQIIGKYAREHEKQQLEKLKKQIAAKQAELEKLQKEHDELSQEKK
uniref:ATPase inhibitor, mitochondrial n=1 Tax=Ganoderma boninense TaxID=34458 RepID=A0A5K1JWM2_9APHY|nr:Mitogen-activated protein kinase kinase [Ganoderma boninense]